MFNTFFWYLKSHLHNRAHMHQRSIVYLYREKSISSWDEDIGQSTKVLVMRSYWNVQHFWYSKSHMHNRAHMHQRSIEYLSREKSISWRGSSWGEKLTRFLDAYSLLASVDEMKWNWIHGASNVEIKPLVGSLAKKACHARRAVLTILFLATIATVARTAWCHLQWNESICRHVKYALRRHESNIERTANQSLPKHWIGMGPCKQIELVHFSEICTCILFMDY